MAGVGKLLKQAQKMQKQMETLQAELAEKTIEVTSGGGAIKIVIDGASKFRSIKLDPEILKESPELIEETLLIAIQEAADKAKELSEGEMSKISSGISLPGLF